MALPNPLFPMVGRESEMAGICRLLADPGCRLLTLVGPGGSGKTRLAIEAARRAAPTLVDGVCFVPMAAISSPESVVPTIAQALGLPSDPSARGHDAQARQLRAYLSRRRMLLVLDNLEYLLDGITVLSEILADAPGITVLATSRARLNLQGERLFPVGGMRYPDPDAIGEIAPGEDTANGRSAVQLFLAGARRAEPCYAPDPSTLRDIARICQQVEGMPLAILLAASWMSTLTPAEIAAELASRGLDLLEADWRDAPRRQQSMRAVFDHSWRLLDPRQPRILESLSVFRGGFTRNAADVVAEATLSDLRTLVGRSLLQHGDSGRYGMHELLRQYASERLGATASRAQEAGQRHADHFLGALVRWDARLKSAEQESALREMDAEYGNVRAAWDWAVGRRQVEALGAAAEGLHDYHYLRTRFQEGESAFQQASESFEPDASPGVGGSWGLLRGLQGSMALSAGRNELARRLITEALDALDRVREAGGDVFCRRVCLLIPHALAALSASQAGRYEAAGETFRLARALGDRWWMGLALREMGAASYYGMGKAGRAREHLEQSLSLFREMGDPRWTVSVQMLLRDLAFGRGDLDAGRRLTAEIVDPCQELGDVISRCNILACSARLAMWEGRFNLAGVLFRESLVLREEAGLTGLLWQPLLRLAEVETHLGEYAMARSHLDAFFALRPGPAGEIVGHDRLGCVALGEGKWDEAAELFSRCASAFTSGMKPYYRLLEGLARAEGIPAPARARWAYLPDLLRMAVQGGSVVALRLSLSASALRFAGEGDCRRALETYGVAETDPVVLNSRWYQDVFWRCIEARCAELSQDVAAEARQRGRGMHRQEVAAELLSEFGGGRYGDLDHEGNVVVPARFL